MTDESHELTKLPSEPKWQVSVAATRLGEDPKRFQEDLAKHLVQGRGHLGKV